MQVFKDLVRRDKESFDNRTLIVDLNNLIHKAVYVLPVLMSEGIYTGGLYGVLNQIKRTIQKFNITRLIVCNDFPPYIRSFILEYKQRRSGDRNQELDKKLDSTRNLCKKFFKLLNIQVWEVRGMESDDLIACLVAKLSGCKYILSNDSDLFQLLIEFHNPLIDGIFLIRNKQTLYTEEDFRKEYNISPSRWAWVSALEGGHNGLPGFEGIGKQKALKIARDENKLMKFIQENPKCILYYHLSKLPLFEIKETPKITSPTKQHFLQAELFLRNLNFKMES